MYRMHIDNGHINSILLNTRLSVLQNGHSTDCITKWTMSIGNTECNLERECVQCVYYTVSTIHIQIPDCTVL